MRLTRKLDAWQAAGLLSAEQTARIRAFEAARGGGAASWVVFALGAAAGVAVVVGLVAIVAANWDEIADWLKLGGVAGLLLGSLVVAWRASGWRTTWPYDLALLAHALLVPAMIGVTAQVYHLSGPPWRTLVVCAVLALPAALLATRSLVTDVLLGYTVGAIFAVAADVDWLETWLGRGFGFGYLSVTLGALAFAAERVAGARRAAQAPALRRWGVALLAVPMVVAAASWGRSWLSIEPWPAGPFVLALAAGGAVAAWRLHPWRERPAAVAAAVLGAAFLAGVPGARWGLDERTAPFAGLGLFCAFCVALAMAAAQAGSRRWVTVSTLAIAVRVVLFYLEISGSLMSTGIGLVVTGLVIGGVAFGWWRVTRAIGAALPSRGEPWRGEPWRGEPTRRVRLGLLVLLAAADILLFGGLILREERARASGAEVRLPVEGYDPRDLLSGQYVRFRLVAEREAAETARALPAGPARFCLDTRGDRAHVVAGPAACEPALLGERGPDGRVRFPVERFYVDERRAREVVRLEAGPDTYVVGRVDRAGRLHLTDLVVAGRSFAGRD